METREYVVPEGASRRARGQGRPDASHQRLARPDEARDGGRGRPGERRRRPKGAVVSEGEVITIVAEAVAEKDGPAVPEPGAPLAVRFESAWVLVVDKPAGQAYRALCVDGETGTLANALVGHYPELAAVGYTPREPGLVHRLDTDTSGSSSWRAAATFEASRRGSRPTASTSRTCSSAARPTSPTAGPSSSPSRAIRRTSAASTPASTRATWPAMRRGRRRRAYDVEERGPRWARVRVEVARALRHQIRVHFAAIEHPLAGDLLYGGEAVSLGHHALHASRVAFEDDTLGFDVSRELPPATAALLREA